MDLREVLTEALDEMTCPHRKAWDGLVTDCHPCVADAIRARLSQPDVLAEFERRLRVRIGFDSAVWREARKVLTDMLGGESCS